MTVGNEVTTQLSPNAQGFLHESLFLAHAQLNVSADVIVPVVRNSLEVYWARDGQKEPVLHRPGSTYIQMQPRNQHVHQPVTRGAVRKCGTQRLRPGSNRGKNLSTGALEWVFDPIWDIVDGLGLNGARGKVPLFGGGYIEAEWKYSSTNATAAGSAPQMTAIVIGNSDGQMVKNKGAA